MWFIRSWPPPRAVTGLICKWNSRTGISPRPCTFLDDWLRENVQSKGSLLTFDDLLVRATGEKLNSQYYLEDLSKRYLGKPNSLSHETAASDGSKLE